MELNAYQAQSRETAVYPGMGNNVFYPALGLCGEAGETAEKVKRIIRDTGGELTEEHRQAIANELGDVLWYLSNLAAELDYSLDEVAEMNLAKLQSRRERDVIKGDGDDR